VTGTGSDITGTGSHVVWKGKPLSGGKKDGGLRRIGLKKIVQNTG